MSQIKDRRILVTGGASGIGLLISLEFARLGCSTLVIWDLNKDALLEAEKKIKAFNVNVITDIIDVSNLNDVQSKAQAVRAKIGGIDMLVNNAGVVVGKYFWEHSHDEIKRTMNINTNALMHISLEFLKDMIHQNAGHIVNISSAAGLVSNPRMSVYCGSKWGVIGWSDSLRLELQEHHPNIKVTTVLPYYINTGMFAGVNSRILPILDPNYVTYKIVQAIQKDKVFLRMPFLVNFVTLLKGIMPAKMFDVVVGGLFGIYKSMDSFKGR